VHSLDYFWHHWTDFTNHTGSDVTKSGPVHQHQNRQQTGRQKTEQQRTDIIPCAKQPGPQKTDEQRADIIPWAELFPPPKRVVKKEVN
jgi:hypothetical protein